MFVALPVPDELKERLAAHQHDLKHALGEGARLAWTNPEGLHLTLKFLGDIPVDRVEEVAHALASAATDCAPLTLSCVGAGVFPSPMRPEVLWAGVKADDGDLILLQSRVEDVCADLGWPREKRRFSPHLTLARIRHLDLDHYSRLRVQSDAPLFLRYRCDELRLYRSELLPGGARYTVLRRILLEGDADGGAR